MRKLLLLVLLLFLAACGAPEETETVDDAAVDDTASSDVSETEAVSRPPAVSADPITPGETAAEAGVIRDRDWTKGAEDPLITIIEYGDYQ